MEHRRSQFIDDRPELVVSIFCSMALRETEIQINIGEIAIPLTHARPLLEIFKVLEDL